MNIIGQIYRIAGKLWKCQGYDKGIYRLTILCSGSQGRWNAEQYLSAEDIYILGGKLEND